MKVIKMYLFLICAVALFSSCSSQEINEAYTELNNNVPQFEKSVITTIAFETYSELDDLGRCGEAFACIGEETMPTEERGKIGQIKPSGWQMTKYDIVDGKYLYNRCHLIGYQLSGENANKKNLITGTRYMNMEGMLPFENMVADYVKETGNHVMYRVTPIFENDNLLAKGVQMEAFSVEDKGKGISFNVFVNNIQPGVVINYSDGTSKLESERDLDEPEEIPKASEDTENLILYSAETSKTEPEAVEAPISLDKTVRYILNTNTLKFHYETCSSVNRIKPENKEAFNGTRDWLLNNGYTPCKKCTP